MSDLILTTANQRLSIDALSLDTRSIDSAAINQNKLDPLTALLAKLSPGEQIAGKILVNNQQVLLELAQIKVQLAAQANALIKQYQNQQVTLELVSKGQPVEFRIVELPNQSKAHPHQAIAKAAQTPPSATSTRDTAKSAAQVNPVIKGSAKGQPTQVSTQQASSPQTSTSSGVDDLLKALRTIAQPKSAAKNVVDTNSSVQQTTAKQPVNTKSTAVRATNLVNTSVTKPTAKSSSSSNKSLDSSTASAHPRNESVNNATKLSAEPKPSIVAQRENNFDSKVQVQQTSAKVNQKPTSSLNSQFKSDVTNQGSTQTNNNSIVNHKTTANKPTNQQPVVTKPATEQKQSTQSFSLKPSTTTKVTQTAGSENLTKTPERINSDKVSNAQIKPESGTQQPVKQDSVKQNSVTREKNNAEPSSIKVKIASADQQRFPEIANAITQAYQQVAKAPMLNQSLNQLLDQLMRLNQWTQQMSHSKHSELGAEVNKQAKKLNEVIQDLFRYVQKSKQPTREQVARQVKHSGTMHEHKLHAKASDKQQLNLHKDLKANLIRVQNTSVYVLAKLAMLIRSHSPQTASQVLQQAHNQTTQTTANSSNTATNTGTSTGQTSSQSASGSGLLPGNSAYEAQNKKAPLIQQIRQRLSGLVTKGISTEQLANLETIAKNILTHTKSALNRTELIQLANIKTDAMANTWLFELPIQTDHGVDLFQVYLEQRKKQQKANSKQWALSVQFDLPPLGKVIGKLVLNNERYDINFYAQHPDTVALIEQELSVFQAQLDKAQIPVERIAVTKQAINDLEIHQ